MVPWLLLGLSVTPQDTTGTARVYEAVLTEVHAAHPGNAWALQDRRVGVACEWHCTDSEEVGSHSPETISHLKATGLVEDACTPASNQIGCRVRKEQMGVGLSSLQPLPDGSVRVYAVLGLTKPGATHPDVRSMEYTLRRDPSCRWRVVSKRVTSVT